MSAFPSSAEPTKGYASHEEACPVVQIKTIGTEQRNPNTLEIDRADTAEILRLMNEEDKKVAPAVEQVLPQVEKAGACTIRFFGSYTAKTSNLLGT